MKHFRHSPYECQILEKIILHYLNEGDFYIDIGAHTGQELIPASQKVGESGQCYGFEPNPYVLKTLDEKIKNLGIKNIKTYSYAIHSHSCIQELEIPKNDPDSQLSTFIQEIKPRFDHTPSFKEVIRVTCECISLDEFFSDAEKIDFIKIDAQGAEPHILKGGVSVLEKFHPILLMEWEEFPDEWAVEAYYLLQKLEYQTFDINQFNKPCLRVTDYLTSQIPDKRTNLLCLPPSVVLYDPFIG